MPRSLASQRHLFYITEVSAMTCPWELKIRSEKEKIQSSPLPMPWALPEIHHPLPALPGAFPMAIPVLLHIRCCPWPCLGRGYHQRSRVTEARLCVPKVMVIHLLGSESPSPEKRVKDDQGLSSVPSLPHLPAPPRWKLPAAMRISNTHSPFLSLFPRTNCIWVHNQPVILKPSQCTIRKAPPSSFPQRWR